MKIKELSIADLKAALDFIKLDLESLERKAKTEKIEPSVSPTWLEVKKVEINVYTELIIRTRSLE